MDADAITTPEALAALFGEVSEASIRKEVDHVHPVYRRWIEASPFAVLATAGPHGLDTSPRGDPAGFVAVEDGGRTLLLPERRGNNRIDSLRNLLHDPRVALLFMIPGAGETLRVNGRASISVRADWLQRFAIDGQLPRCVLAIRVETVLFQCARAVKRSRLWQAAGEPVSAGVPSAGAMLAALTAGAIDGDAYDRALPARQQATLY